MIVRQLVRRLAVLLLYLEVCDLHLCKRSHKSFTLTDLQQASSLDLSDGDIICVLLSQTPLCLRRVRATPFPSPDHNSLYIPRICRDADQWETTLQDVPDNDHQTTTSLTASLSRPSNRLMRPESSPTIKSRDCLRVSPNSLHVIGYSPRNISMVVSDWGR